MTMSELQAQTAELRLSAGATSPQPFGKSMRKYFNFPDTWRNLNHGAFGACPKPVQDALREFQDEAEARPDKFQRFDQVRYLNAARREVAELVHAPLSTVVFVQNATTGINTFLRNLVYNPGDAIMYFSCSYGSCQKLVLSIAETTAAVGHRISLDYPMTADEFVKLFVDNIAAIKARGQTPKAAILDTISSLPGVRMPFERLIALCKEHGILSVIDGAHSIGQIPLDLPAFDPDCFVTNLHKWLYVPRACALMYVPHRNQDIVRTSFPTSHYFEPLATDGDDAQISNPLQPLGKDDTRFTKLFEFVGTLDTSPYLAVPAALEFRRDVCGGEEAIMKYSSDLAAKGGALVAEWLGTAIMDNNQGTMSQGCAMVCVKLPLVAPGSYRKSSAEGRAQVNGDGADSTIELDAQGPEGVCSFIQRVMIHEFETFIAIFFHNGSFWARFSAQTYLDIGDFEFGADVLTKLCKRVKAGEHLL